MDFVLEIWHSVSTLDELLDIFEIVFLAVFEALTIMEDEMLVVGRDYFDLDIRYACFAMCYFLFYDPMRWKIRNHERTYCFVGSESKINQGRLPDAGLEVDVA